MGHTYVKVNGRKKHTNTNETNLSVFEKIRRERQVENRKLLEHYNKEIKKIVHSR